LVGYRGDGGAWCGSRALVNWRAMASRTDRDRVSRSRRMAAPERETVRRWLMAGGDDTAGESLEVT
jgi:hypothetical protein